MKLVPTILCGGAGSRLWPVSRETYPKPFIKLADGQSFLQKTWLRATNLPDINSVITISNRELCFNVKDDYQEILNNGAGASVFNHYIFEPVGRNTAPAIAAAALHARQDYGDDTILLILPADHLIEKQDVFFDAVHKACKLAKQGKLVTFGTKPTSPETGYGYIESEGHRVLQFIEKPNLETAQAYIASERFLWNSGMFCFSVSHLLHEMALHCPFILDAVKNCMNISPSLKNQNFSQRELDLSTFGDVPNESIDYALMEKSLNVAVIPCDIGWRDIGSWRSLGDLLEPDVQGNRIEGKTVLHNVSNCHIQATHRCVGAVGVDNLVIVDTPDALLVADRNNTQDVKHLYNQLKNHGDDTYKWHDTVHRPWGQYTVLDIGHQFKIKRIKVKPGASLSLQMHHHRSEHWVVVSGIAKIVNDNCQILLHPNESTYIPARHKHRLSNPGLVDAVIIEVQSGDYLGEDDIIRFDDEYGRGK